MEDRDIQQLIRSEIATAQNDALYSTKNAASHTHNGIDSPLVVTSTIVNKSVTTQFNKTTDTTLANITNLVATIGIGTFIFDATLYVTADATGGSKYTVAFSGTQTAVVWEAVLIDNNTSAISLANRRTAVGSGASVGQAGNTSPFCKIHGRINVTVAGNLSIQFAQNASNLTSSVLVGSDLQVISST